MAESKSLTGGAGTTPIDLTTGLKAAPARLIALGPETPVPALVAGSQHLVLPDTSPLSSPMRFAIDGSIGGANLTGMGVAESIIEYPLIGMVLFLINIGTSLVTTSANSTGSPAGMRFAAAVNLQPNLAAQFVCEEVAGVKKWFPVAWQAFG